VRDSVGRLCVFDVTQDMMPSDKEFDDVTVGCVFDVIGQSASS